MLRRLVIVLLVFTSLFAQVSTAYACAMTGQVVMHDCCCDDDGDAPDALPQPSQAGAAADDCCRPLALIGDRAGAPEGGVHKPPYDPDPWPLLAVAVALLVPEAPPGVAAPPRQRAAPAASGTHTWLLTARLRI